MYITFFLFLVIKVLYKWETNINESFKIVCSESDQEVCVLTLSAKGKFLIHEIRRNSVSISHTRKSWKLTFWCSKFKIGRESVHLWFQIPPMDDKLYSFVQTYTVPQLGNVEQCNRRILLKSRLFSNKKSETTNFVKMEKLIFRHLHKL